MKTSNLLLLGALLASPLGCRCGPVTNTTLPDLVATPTAVSFEACPTRDEANQPVPDVFPDTRKVLLSNRNRVATGITLSLTGPGAANFSLGNMVPTDIGSLGELELPITFAPTTRGDVRAELVVDDQTDETENPVVTLIGTGTNLPSQATIETAPQKLDRSGFLTCTPESPLSDCIVEFPDTLMDQDVTMQLKLRNKGCPALKITDLAIESLNGDTQGFAVASPAVLPTTGAPLLLSTANGTEETVITLRFTATDDGTGAASQGRYATLVIKSNDPLYGAGDRNPARISLQANAVKPSMYVTPTSCNFTNTLDACGNTPRVANKASFRVTNDGATAIRISSVKFKSSGGTTSTNTRFSITQNIDGQTISPNSSATLEVTEVDMPLLVQDQLEIVADIVGQGAASGGKVVLSVVSGIKPCLTTDPMDSIDFGDPADELTARTLRIRNGAGCGTLTISSVTASGAQYSLLEPLIPPNSSVPAGGSLETTVQYKRPTSGGIQLGDVRIVSNDTDFGPPEYKVVLLQSNASFDPIPQANLTACEPAELVNDPDCALGAQNSAAFNLSRITPDEITLSGITSTDNNMVKEYRFALLPPFPSGVTTAVLANHGVRITTNKTKLTIPSGAVGTYRVGLEVWDDRGQKSGSTATMTVNVYP